MVFEYELCGIDKIQYQLIALIPGETLQSSNESCTPVAQHP
jgi:hypothetical protein